MLALLGLLLLLALLVCVVVLPIVAIVRTARIAQLDERVTWLTKEVARLRRVAQEREAPLPVLTPVEQPAESTPAEVPTATPAPTAARPGELPLALPVPPPPRRAPAAPWVEEWIGGRGLGWAAVVLLIFAAGFFLKVAFENEWVGELARVAIGVVAGAGLCAFGLRCHRRGRRAFSQMLTAAGIVLLYLAAYATFGFYHLLPRQHGALFLIALVAEAAALAVVYEAPAIALMAVLGGLLTPVLLHTDRDQYVSLFVYLTALNVGAVGLSLLRRWPALATVALLGTHLLFWGWYAERFHPDKLPAALAFLSGLFVLYLAQPVLASLLRRPTDWETALPEWWRVEGGGWRVKTENAPSSPSTLHPPPSTTGVAGVEDVGRLVLNAFLFAGAGYVLLDPDHHAWIGALALVLASVHTLPASLLFARRPEDARLVLVLVATAMAFVAAAIPLQASAAWVAVAWAVQGLVLWGFGLRVSAQWVRGLGAALLVLAAGRLLFADTPRAHPEPFVPLVNRYGLPATAVAACVVLAGVLGRRYLARLSPVDRVLVRGTGVAGVVLLWIVLSVEAYDYFGVRADLLMAGPGGAETDDVKGRSSQEVRAEEWEHLRQSAQVALSVVWALYAAAVLAVGFRLPSLPLRWGSLGLFGLTLAKVLLVDMARLPGLYRVAALLALALLMGAAAWGYQRMGAVFLSEQQKGGANEPT